MGYIIAIGNAYPELTEEGKYILYIEPLSDAEFGENNKMPSYSQWCHFCKHTGLTDFFEDNFEPSSFTKITEEHLVVVETAYQNFLERHPNVTEPKHDGEQFEAHLARLVSLVWLKHWLNYAFENCKNPCIYVSE